MQVMNNAKDLINDIHQTIHQAVSESEKLEEVCKHGVARFITGNEVFSMSGEKRYDIIENKCDQCENERLEQDFKELLIPTRYINSPRESKYYDDYKKKQGIIFAGTVGTGKTFELVSLIKTIFLKEKTKCSFKTGVDIAYELKKSIGENKLDYVIQSLKSSNVLVIDDLGVESATPFMLENLYHIINYRYNWMMPIIITTNLDSKKLKEVYGDRLISRLLEMLTPIKFTGEDKRI